MIATGYQPAVPVPPPNLPGKAVREPRRAPNTNQAAPVEAPRAVVCRAEELSEHVKAWDDLAAHASEPNPFYESWMALPAIEAFGGEDLMFVLIYAPDPARPGREMMLGFFPIERQRRYRRLPVPALTMWNYKYCCLCTPLLRRGEERRALTIFFEWLRGGGHGGTMMEFRFVTGDGPFSAALAEVLRERGQVFTKPEIIARALLKPAADAETFLRAAVSGVHRKDFRRKEKRLGELGRVEYRALEHAGELEEWIEYFLRLEASGWKGQEHSAMASIPADRDYFRKVARAAFERGRLMMLALTVDGKPVAHKCNFLAGDGGFAFKIGFDESFAHYSPGVLLELENIRRLHETQRWMDSCAQPDHPMINRLWPDRRTIETVLVGANRAGDFLAAALPLLQWLNRRLKTLMRRRSTGTEN